MSSSYVVNTHSTVVNKTYSTCKSKATSGFSLFVVLLHFFEL